MDSMIIKSKIVTGILSALISREAKKKFGVDVIIHLDQLQIQHSEKGRIKIHLNVDAEADSDSVFPIIKDALRL